MAASWGGRSFALSLLYANFFALSLLYANFFALSLPYTNFFALSLPYTNFFALSLLYANSPDIRKKLVRGVKRKILVGMDGGKQFQCCNALASFSQCRSNCSGLVRVRTLSGRRFQQIFHDINDAKWAKVDASLAGNMARWRASFHQGKLQAA